jgi:hypothetical protein
MVLQLGANILGKAGTDQEQFMVMMDGVGKRPRCKL